ncbi:hypothetical protein RQP46_002825 [Phenoliferia psychrophenolica]
MHSKRDVRGGERRPLATRPQPPAHGRTSRRGLRRSATRALLGALVLPLLVYAYIVATWDRLNSSLVDPLLVGARSILWVTAHPDDESFFFAPTILNLLAERPVDGHLLCLSIGDHEGAGATRKLELESSCEALGISAANCVALDHPLLQDTPTEWWPPAVVDEVVRDYVSRRKVDLIITFDDYGVSGHANHRAVSLALQSSARSDPTFPPIFLISSTDLLSKYSSLLSLPFVLLERQFPLLRGPRLPSSLFINSPTQYLQARVSFAQHESQKRWFRSLFILFSRYLWFVNLEGPVL